MSNGQKLGYQKSEEILTKVYALESPTRLLSGFLSLSEAAMLIDVYGEAKKMGADVQRRSESAIGPNNLRVNPVGAAYKKVESFLMDKVSPFLGNDFGLRFSYHLNHVPYDLHTDAGYDASEVIYKQGIIPLAVEPLASQVYTVIMNERCYWSDDFSTQKKYSQIERMGNEISDQELSKFWSLEEKDKYSHFSIDHAFEWSIGNSIVWDRSRIHGSNDFLRHGAQSKLGLMWISYLNR